MKTFLLFIISLFLISITKIHAQIDTAWTRVFGDVFWEEMHSITIDPNGNAYVAGWKKYSSSNYDWAVAKFNSNGTQEWLNTHSDAPGSGSDLVELSANDLDGNVILVGYTNSYFLKLIKYNTSGDTLWTALNTYYNGVHISSVKIDNSGNVLLVGYYDSPRKGLLIKYNQNGVEQWAKVFNSPTFGYCEFADLAADNYGNIYTAGRCEYGTATYDALLVKYNALGDTIWTRHWNGPGTEPYDEAVKINLDALNNIFIGGNTSASLQSPMNYATLLYDTMGNFKWSRFFDGADKRNDGIVDMVADHSGNVLVTGWSATAPNNFDFVTIKYNNLGDTLWTQRYGGFYSDYPSSMIMDADKNTYITGYGINAGGDGGWNGITIKYDSAGVEKWVAFYNGTSSGEDELYDLVLDKNNDILVTGRSGGDTTSFNFLIIKYQNSVAGIPLIESGNPDLHLSCFPNPGSGSTQLAYYLPFTGDVNLRICDETGKEFFMSGQGRQLTGNHTLQLNTTDFTVGLYFCRLTLNNIEKSIRLIVAK